MILSLRFCLSFDSLNVILSPSKFAYFNIKLHCCYGHWQDATCSRRKCHVTCGHNIISDMTYPLNNSNLMINAIKQQFHKSRII